MDKAAAFGAQCYLLPRDLGFTCLRVDPKPTTDTIVFRLIDSKRSMAAGRRKSLPERLTCFIWLSRILESNDRFSFFLFRKIGMLCFAFLFLKIGFHPIELSVSPVPMAFLLQCRSVCHIWRAYDLENNITLQTYLSQTYLCFLPHTRIFLFCTKTRRCSQLGRRKRTKTTWKVAFVKTWC